MGYKISDICYINSNSLSAKDKLEFINYLDTSSLTEGRITELQKLKIGKDKIPSRAKRKVKKNDILISTVRPNQKHYGILKNIKENMIVSTGFTVLSAKEDIVDSEYLYRFLTQVNITEYLQAIAETSTSTYPSITTNVIGELKIDLPPIEEQKAIAHILSTLDEKIEVSNQINKTLESMAQALFKHWFVDFEFPNENGEPYKSSGGEMVKSEMGMIPKGWEVGRFIDYIDVLSGGTPKTTVKQYWDGDIPFFTPKDSRGIYCINTENTITEIGLNRCNSKLYDANTVFITARGTVGKVCIAGKKMAMNQSCYALVGKDNVNQYFVYLLTKKVADELQRNASGSVFDAIVVDTFKSVRVARPENKQLEAFERVMEPIYFTILTLYFENEKLRDIRDTLLPKLMSGEIRVTIDQEGEV